MVKLQKADCRLGPGRGRLIFLSVSRDLSFVVGAAFSAFYDGRLPKCRSTNPRAYVQSAGDPPEMVGP